MEKNLKEYHMIMGKKTSNVFHFIITMVGNSELPNIDHQNIIKIKIKEKVSLNKIL